MEQSKLGSFVEATINTIVGFLINLCANFFLIPLCLHIEVSIRSNVILGLFFTVISVVRGYILRRFFNTYLRNSKD